MCDVGYLSANFSLLRPLYSRVMPDVQDRRQTDRRQTKASLNASALGVIIVVSACINTMITVITNQNVVKLPKFEYLYNKLGSLRTMVKAHYCLQMSKFYIDSRAQRLGRA